MGIGGGGVGVVTPDGVDDVDAVLHQLVGGDLLWILARLDEAALRDDPVLAARILPGHQPERPGPVARDAVAALCTPDADRSAARSSVAQGVAVLLARTGSQDAECSKPTVPTAHWRR